MSIELLPFQAKASESIAKRHLELISDEFRPMVHRHWDVPFYQALSALTGAGKTPILADSVTQIRANLANEPIVLWISKAKAVVDQTFSNFDAGGKYSHLIDGFLITYLNDLKPDVIEDDSIPFIALATVGSFNQKGRSEGTLKVHQTDIDSANDSLWTLLKNRISKSNTRRPLVLVYDEGHNLSDQQTELLLELEPDAILVASATMKTPGRLGKMIDRLKEHSWSDEKLVTSVPSKAVVEAGLVKKQVVLGGYSSIMEAALNDMLDQMEVVTEKAAAMGAGFLPKAIYVCRTNISQDDGTLDNSMRPFRERKAPPILIWRHLVEERGIAPSEIAVYCDLKFDRKNNPPPEDFILFSGGEDDFNIFTSGNFRHIIFNQSLQEGWDDPSCCFAYIDKSMGSTIQVEQVIGRVLRQPGAKHYPDYDLNTANFYIRIDDKQIFPQILQTVRKRIAAEMPEVKISSYTNPKGRQQMTIFPKEVKCMPQIHIDSDSAVEPLNEAINLLSDYRSDKVNTIGKGELIKAVQGIGDGTKAVIETQDTPHSNRITARWLLRRSIQSLYPEAIKTIDWSNPKFDAKIEMTSPAASILKDYADKLTDIYLENSDLVFEDENPYTVSSLFIDPAKVENFDNSIHSGYSDLKENELLVARAIDETGFLWARNPSNGGFSIPLLDKGDTRNFYPDFLVWKENIIFAIDPKGDHLISKAAALKLLDIRDDKNNRRIIVKLITQGKWEDTLSPKSPLGFTVWSMKAGKPRPKYCTSINEAIQTCLKV